MRYLLLPLFLLSGLSHASLTTCEILARDMENRMYVVKENRKETEKLVKEAAKEQDLGSIYTNQLAELNKTNNEVYQDLANISTVFTTLKCDQKLLNKLK